MAYPALINGTRHSWANIEIVLFNRPVIGITEINYNQKQEKEDFFGAGNNPVHRGRGNKMATASIKMYKYEVDALNAAAKAAAGNPGADITEIGAFNIAVVYRPSGSDILRTDVLHNVEFTELDAAFKQGDRMLEINLPLIVSHIEYNRI